MSDNLQLRVISLGAGVQSTTLALMAAHGEIGPMPDCAIFADTGAEPRSVYEHLAWLSSPNVLPFPVHIVRAGSIFDDITRAEGARKRFAPIPYFLDKKGGKGMARRQCTREYKIEPIAKKQRELFGFKPRARIPEGTVEVWIGISTDEIQRMKDARNAWQKNRWPLIESRMSRLDCASWLVSKSYPTPPKSACTFCPYRTNASWREMKNDPESWAQIVAVDEAIRDQKDVLRLRATPYLHRSLRPIDEVDLSTPAEQGQSEFEFEQECDGMCGV